MGRPGNVLVPLPDCRIYQDFTIPVSYTKKAEEQRTMRRLIYAIKPLIPARIWGWLTTPYWWWYNRASHQFSSLYDRRLAKSQAKLAAYKNIHAGERCFIIGNGPSLNRTDLSRLEGEHTFGMNRIYLLFPELGFQTSFFVSINSLVIEQCSEDIQRLDMPKFLTWRGRKWISRDSDSIFIDTDYTPPSTFSKDVSGRIFEGSTVTYVALQLAYHMGFEEVILVGVDHHFTSTGRPNETVISDGGDPNHFSSDYFGKGFRWQLPDLAASEAAYRLAEEAYDRAGRRVLDATVGGELTIFPKVQFETLFSR
jgi:hypothetical protein